MDNRGPRSALLESQRWLEYAFQPAGQPAPAAAAYGQQRHSAKVVLAGQNRPPKSCESDGVISDDHQPVAVYTADCLPVLFADVKTHQVAAVHAGLQGTLGGVLSSALDQLLAGGATPASLLVAIGPAIGPCCYELGVDRIAQMQQRPDLPALHRRLQGLLEGSGQRRILWLGLATREHPQQTAPVAAHGAVDGGTLLAQAG